MRVIDFSVPLNEIEIVPCADWHIGSPQCDVNLIKEMCEYIAKTPNCYTILNGDLVDNNIVNAVGSVFEATMSPLEQVVRAAYYLQDVAKQGKIINMTSGNHEQRTAKGVALSPSDLLLAKLMAYDETLNERYCEDGAFTFLTMNGRKSNEHKSKIVFTIFNLHGSGSGSKIGGKIQRLDDMSNIVSANLYIRSHTHQPETHRGVIMAVNTNFHTVKEESCVYVNTGSALLYGGYGARAGMKPLSRGIPVITLRVLRKNHKREELYIKEIDCTIKERLL